jgi:hypothetical protein
VLLYAPQLVGYARIALLGTALLSGAARPHLTAGLFVANFVLDGLDGYLARRLKQVREHPLILLVHACMSLACSGSGTCDRDAAMGPGRMQCRISAGVLRIQASAFGAFLDVTIDCCSRGALYAWALAGPGAAFPIALEFLTFVATHKVTLRLLPCWVHAAPCMALKALSRMRASQLWCCHAGRAVKCQPLHATGRGSGMEKRLF